jgi:flavin reductase (DIM6/NTAB) family NADH-FMN oxidoreductase RutF
MFYHFMRAAVQADGENSRRIDTLRRACYLLEKFRNDRLSMTIDAQELRRVMGHFATGVTVITTKDSDGTPNGLTANAFMSLSLNPPLVLISVDKGATCYACFELQNGFTVNFLGEGQEEISRRFATKGADKFAGLQWHAGSNGAAVIDGAIGYVECKITQCHDGGDHTIVVGEVINVNATGDRPLLFFKGKYQRLPD